jgi:pyridoxamine 5'-phosphate oxidase
VRRSELDPDPLRQFQAWFAAARAAGVGVPETMTLATAARDGRPSARQVLLKDCDERGFVFFSGYESRKGRELAENPRAALLFHWAPLGRQARVEGSIERVTRDESEAYWRRRPLGARLSASVSRQSEPVDSRDELEARVAALRVSGDEPPLPAHWGGYRLVADVYEFWEHRDDRLHDRFRYLQSGDGWTIERLSP